MKVEIENNTYVHVGEIKIGNTFMYDEEPYMVISLNRIVGACPNCADTYGANRFIGDDEFIIAVNLEDGIVAEFRPSIQVAVIPLKVTKD